MSLVPFLCIHSGHITKIKTWLNVLLKTNIHYMINHILLTIWDKEFEK